MDNKITFEEFTENLKKWAADRDLLTKDPHIQFTKIVEELGETSAAYNKKKQYELLDGIGDLFVTIVVWCQQLGIDPLNPINIAWNEIANRTGKTVDGVFIKDADLKDGDN